VLDQYLSFVTPSPQLFSLLPPTTVSSTAIAASTSATANLTATDTPATDATSYYILNAPSTAETAIEAEIDRIASGLFSVIVTTGQVPYIRSPRRNAAEMVARKLNGKIRDHLLNATRTGKSLFSGDGSGVGALGRPVLLILDRNVDLVSMIAHGWTYQSLIHDCLEMRLGRVTVVCGVELLIIFYFSYHFSPILRKRRRGPMISIPPTTSGRRTHRIRSLKWRRRLTQSWESINRMPQISPALPA